MDSRRTGKIKINSAVFLLLMGWAGLWSSSCMFNTQDSPTTISLDSTVRFADFSKVVIAVASASSDSLDTIFNGSPSPPSAFQNMNPGRFLGQPVTLRIEGYQDSLRVYLKSISIGDFRGSITIARADLKLPHFEYVGHAHLSPSEAYSIGLAIGVDGNAFTAYGDRSDSRRPVVMRYSAVTKAWNTLGRGGLSQGPVQTIVLASNPSGTPYVAFNDEADSLRVSVKSWNSVTEHWDSVGQKGISPSGTVQFTLAIGPAGETYLAYKDERHGFQTSVLEFNPYRNTWEVIGDTGFADSEGNYFSLAIDPLGKPHLAYCDESRRGRATVLGYNRATRRWDFIGEPGFSSSAIGTSMAIDAQGVPYLAFSDATDNAFKATVMRYLPVAGNWSLVGPEGFSPGQANMPSIAIGPQGAPYVAFRDQENSGALGLMRWNEANTKWENIADDGLPKIPIWTPALVFGPEGEPWVAFLESDGNRLSVMRWTEFP